MRGNDLNLQRRGLIVCMSDEVGGRIANFGLEQFNGSAEDLVLSIKRRTGPKVEEGEGVGVSVRDWENRFQDMGMVFFERDFQRFS